MKIVLEFWDNGENETLEEEVSSFKYIDYLIDRIEREGIFHNEKLEQYVLIKDDPHRKVRLEVFGHYGEGQYLCQVIPLQKSGQSE